MTKKLPNTPTHLGLILDGNRRWAKANGIPQLEGHRKGYENLKTIGIAAIERGIPYLSAYVFSTENWERSQQEVAYLMKLLIWFARHEVQELHRSGIKVQLVGSRHGLSAPVLKAIDEAEHKTRNNTKGTLGLCLNYGGWQEIADASKEIVKAGMEATKITPKLFQEYLYAPDIPSLDLIIRSSGEQRLSNFMLWRAAYSELYFTPKFWPDFNEDDLDLALAEYARRKRSFGS